MKKRAFIAVCSIAMISISCESHRVISVTVVDSITRQSLDSVQVEVSVGKDGDYTVDEVGYTDATGEFKTGITTGFFSRGRHHIQLKYTKKGYAPRTDVDLIEGEIPL